MKVNWKKVGQYILLVIAARNKAFNVSGLILLIFVYF